MTLQSLLSRDAYPDTDPFVSSLRRLNSTPLGPLFELDATVLLDFTFSRLERERVLAREVEVARLVGLFLQTQARDCEFENDTEPALFRVCFVCGFFCLSSPRPSLASILAANPIRLTPCPNPNSNQTVIFSVFFFAASRQQEKTDNLEKQK